MTPVAIKIIGHALEVLGAFALAYELLRGYPQRNRLQIAEVKLEQLKRFLEQMESSIDQLPARYTQAERDEEKRKLQAKWTPDLQHLNHEVAKRGHGHEVLSFYFGLIGSGFLIVGFLLQIIAELAAE